jgi:hypothetical protein
MAAPNHDSLVEQNARMKDLSRDSRLSFRNFAEHQLRQELKEIAMEKCKAPIAAFAGCAEEKGIMVVFSCRDLHREVQNCLSVHNGEEAWQKYKEDNKDELERRAKMERKR